MVREIVASASGLAYIFRVDPSAYAKINLDPEPVDSRSADAMTPLNDSLRRSISKKP